MKKFSNPRLMLIASMTIFGTLGPFVRNIPVSSGELALYRAVLAALLIALFLLITKQKIPFSLMKKEVPLLLASGMAMGINWILLFEADSAIRCYLVFPMSNRLLSAHMEAGLQ